MLQLFSAFLKEEEGQGLVEYALLLALIAIVCIAALTALGKGVEGTFNTANGEL